jgi:hypothetical protein
MSLISSPANPPLIRRFCACGDGCRRFAWAFFWLITLLSLPAWAQIGPDVDGATVADHGDYYYDGRQYDDLTAANLLADAVDATDSVVYSVQESTAFLDRATSFGAWNTFHNGQGTVGLRADLGLGRWRPGFRHEALRHRQLRGLRLGPLYITDIYAGAGLMYSEYQGRPPRSGRFRPGDDPWAAILWTSFTVSAYITDTFALSVRPFIYWLPLEGKVGYAGPAGFLGFNPGVMPNTMLEMAYHVPLGTWDMYFYERFDAVMAQAGILDENLFFWGSIRDYSEYDTAGRYGFGGFGVPVADARGNANFSINDRLFDEDRLLFRNTAGVTLNGHLAEDVTASFFYRRADRWDNDFDHLSGWNTAGALLVKQYLRGTLYAGYNISHLDVQDTTIQWAYAGASVALGPRLWLDGRAGYMWNEGVRGRDSWIGQVSLEHQLGPFTWHGLSFGRRVTDPDFGARYLADYIRYVLVHDFSDRAQMRVFAQYADAERLDNIALSDYSSFVAGVLLSFAISPSDELMVLNTYETYDLNNARRDWTLWTHRLAYVRRLTDDCSAQFYYQYQHGNANILAGDDFTEHLIYLGVVKRF